MKQIIFSLSFIMISCAHRPAMEKTVQFPYAGELLQKVQQSAARAPASVESDEQTGKSARRVYFSALYHQYLALGSYFQKETEIASCPQFHHDKLETEAYTVPKIALYKPNHIQEEGKNFFPELAFAGKDSLKEYHQGMRQELEVLCEEGLSDNFYKFDNLVTHYAHNKSFHLRPQAMESVLKIPVFANFYLVKMLSAQRGMDLSHPEETRFIEMTQTHWFKNYISEASRLRSSFIKNKLVKR